MNDSNKFSNFQNWAGMSGSVAWHLIDRHAENDEETGLMMQAWKDANKHIDPPIPPGNGARVLSPALSPVEAWYAAFNQSEGWAELCDLMESWRADSSPG